MAPVYPGICYLNNHTKANQPRGKGVLFQTAQTAQSIPKHTQGINKRLLIFMPADMVIVFTLQLELYKAVIRFFLLRLLKCTSVYLCRNSPNDQL